MMLAISFDMRVAEIEVTRPVGFQRAYGDTERTLKAAGFRRIQGSVFRSDDEGLSHLTHAMTALRELPWFANCVRDIRAFRVENWSDFMPFFKGTPA